MSADPEKPEELKKLERLLGVWLVKGTITMGGKPAAISGRWEFTEVAAGWGVNVSQHTEIEGMSAIEEMVLFNRPRRVLTPSCPNKTRLTW